MQTHDTWMQLTAFSNLTALCSIIKKFIRDKCVQDNYPDTVSLIKIAVKLHKRRPLIIQIEMIQLKIQRF